MKINQPRNWEVASGDFYLAKTSILRNRRYKPIDTYSTLFNCELRSKNDSQNVF